jgi:hypothetical protein
VEWCAKLVRDQRQERVFRTIEDRQPLVCGGELTCAHSYSLLQTLILLFQCSLEFVQLEMGFDPSVNLFELERFGYIVHRTGLESSHLVLDLIQGAQKDDGDV